MDDMTHLKVNEHPGATGLETQGDSGSPPNPENVEPKALSKKAIKKAAKAERLAVLKLERRVREKEARKEKKRISAAKRALGELVEGEDENVRKKKRRIYWGGKVVIDLGFDEMMSEKEIKSLCSQLAYTYSANRNAEYPFSLVYTSLNGRTFSRLESMNDAGYKRWTNTEWWYEGYDRIWLEEGPWSSALNEEEAGNSGQVTPVSESLTDRESSRRQAILQKVVYLTADSEEELTELKPEEIYIIGGICDHNRYKNLCLSKAKESGVRTARLPIGRYLASLPTRKVLTVNQVFEILLRWVETKDWEEALYTVIPKRKFQGSGKGSSVEYRTADVGKGEEGLVSEEGALVLIEAGQENQL